MSFSRFVYYSAVIGGWAALAAWLVAELLFLRSGWLRGTAETVLTAALAGAALGAALNLVSGMSNPRWRRQLGRLVPGLVGGGLGGAAGGLLGAAVYSALDLPSGLGWIARGLGWMVMGAGIGMAEGVYEASRKKIRNGLIGGCLGGLVGGLLFDPIAASGSAAPSQATAFVILGLSIGALVGLTHVALKEAWLTVLDGFRPGRQLILTAPVTVLGRGDHLPLPFLGYAGRDLESEHSEIVRQPDGAYLLRDRGTRVGTRLNGHVIDEAAVLNDGDVIKLGTNLVRFNHRHRAAGPLAEELSPGGAGGGGRIAPPPLPPQSEGRPRVPPSPAPPRPTPRIPPPPPPPS